MIGHSSAHLPATSYRGVGVRRHDRGRRRFTETPYSQSASEHEHSLRQATAWLGSNRLLMLGDVNAGPFCFGGTLDEVEASLDV